MFLSPWIQLTCKLVLLLMVSMPEAAPAQTKLPSTCQEQFAGEKDEKFVYLFETLQTLLANEVGEIVEGALHIHPRLGLEYSRVASSLSALILGPFMLGYGGPGGWQILSQPDLKLKNSWAFDIMKPFMAGWRIERLADREIAGSHITTSPDWVVEVVTPVTEDFIRSIKAPAYAKAGVRFLWLIDRDAKILEVHGYSAEELILHRVINGSRRVRIEPFTQLQLPIGMLWGKRPRKRLPRSKITYSDTTLARLCELFGVQELAAIGRSVHEELPYGESLQLVLTLKPGKQITPFERAHFEGRLHSLFHKKVRLLDRDIFNTQATDSRYEQALESRQILFSESQSQKDVS